LEMANLGHWEYDIANDLFTFNDQFYKIFHTTAEQSGGYTMHSAEYAQRFVHPGDVAVVVEETRKAIETTDPHFNRTIEHQMLYTDGTVGYISVRFFIVKDSHGRTVKTYGVNQDITKRKRAEEALKQSKEQLRFLSSRLLDAQEEERKRIARELHDSIGQSLAAIKFNVENVLADTGKHLNGRTVNSLQQIISLVRNSMEEVRRIYTGLRPSMLDDLGIIATIGWFCRDFQRTYESICIKQQMGIEEADIPEPLKIVIFRIVQEALNNIAKHSGAESVNLCLEKKDGRIELAIDDNGAGFDVDSALAKSRHHKGLGIAGMKERTELTGGTFCMESVIGEGSTIHAAWPMEHHL
jgi:signal transduction histidine kinase